MVNNVFTTGSGEASPILYVEGSSAKDTFGVEKRYSQGCPNCKGPVVELLSFNPTDSYYYLTGCPVCGKTIRYCDINGNLVKTFTIVTSRKSTPLDIDDDFPTRTGTF